jgi:hypothetical protein
MWMPCVHTGSGRWVGFCWLHDDALVYTLILSGDHVGQRVSCPRNGSSVLGAHRLAELHVRQDVGTSMCLFGVCFWTRFSGACGFRSDNDDDLLTRSTALRLSAHGMLHALLAGKLDHQRTRSFDVLSCGPCIHVMCEETFEVMLASTGPLVCHRVDARCLQVVVHAKESSTTSPVVWFDARITGTGARLVSTSTSEVSCNVKLQAAEVRCPAMLPGSYPL